jgi:hypothetical protein
MGWVRIIGNLKSSNNKRLVLSNHIYPVEDPNEIFFHQLSALAAHLALTQPHVLQSQNDSNAQASGNPNSVYSAAASAGGTGTEDQYADLPELVKAVLIWMKSHSIGDSAISITQIAIGLQAERPGVDAAQIL